MYLNRFYKKGSVVHSLFYMAQIYMPDLYRVRFYMPDSAGYLPAGVVIFKAGCARIRRILRIGAGWRKYGFYEEGKHGQYIWVYTGIIDRPE